MYTICSAQFVNLRKVEIVLHILRSEKKCVPISKLRTVTAQCRKLLSPTPSLETLGSQMPSSTQSPSPVDGHKPMLVLPPPPPPLPVYVRYRLDGLRSIVVFFINTHWTLSWHRGYAVLV